MRRSSVCSRASRPAESARHRKSSLARALTAETTLEAYIRIPNQSPSFEPDWEASGHTAAAVELLCNWVRAQGVAGLVLEVLRAPGRTPLIFIELPAWAPPGAALPTQTVMLYGHLDKQCVPRTQALLPVRAAAAPLLAPLLTPAPAPRRRPPPPAGRP